MKRAQPLRLITMKAAALYRAVQEDQDEVIVEGGQRDDADVDDDLGHERARLVGRPPQQEHAEIPQREAGDEIGEEAIQPAAGVAQQRDPEQGNVEEESGEREELMQAHRYLSRRLSSSNSSLRIPNT